MDKEQIKQTVLITAETLGGTRDSHAKWLYLLLRTQLKSALKEAVVVHASFHDAPLEAVDLVIGFELSKEAVAKLNSMGKVYIDLRIHPIRFMDDLFFSFETNSDAVRTKLERFKIADEFCRLQASLVSATVIKQKKDKIIAPESLLLIGQTEADRVIFDGKKYLTLLDRTDEIRILASNYEHIYFKPHPYARNNRYLLRELRKIFGKIQSTHDNIYHLLANDGVMHVAALNSSVLYEAACFEKRTTFLFEPTFTDRQVGIYMDYLGASFWSDILAPVLQTVPSSLELPFQANRIRKVLNDFWGYNEISDEIVLTDIIKSRIKRLLSRYIR
jgi:hypothetical protein